MSFIEIRINFFIPPQLGGPPFRDFLEGVRNVFLAAARRQKMAGYTKKY